MSNLHVDISNPDLFCPVYLPFIKSRARTAILYGGRDSGKSFAIAQRIVIALLTERHCKVVLLRKTYSSIKDSQVDTIWSVIESWGLTSYFDLCRAPLEIRARNGNIVLARGLDKPAKLKSVSEPTICWLEEADEVTQNDYIASDMSIRSKYPNALLMTILSLNSEKELSWINEMFFPPKATYEKEDGTHLWVKSTQENTIILHTTYKNNTYCPISRGERYEHLQNLPGADSDNFFRVYCKGLWGNALEGLVFPKYETAESFPNIEDCKHYGYAIDYGFTNDPTAVVECALSGGKFYVQEHLYKTGLVTRYNPITPNLPNVESELKRIGVQKYPIYAESAEPKTNAELLSAKLTIKPVRKPKGSIAQSIAAINRYPLVIVGGSPNMKKELKSYVYKKDKNGVLTNEPIDAWNHLLDATRYFALANLTGFDSAQGGVSTMPGLW